jgi:hypothetical protein
MAVKEINKTKYADKIRYVVWRFRYYLGVKDLIYDEIDGAVKSGKIIAGSNPLGCPSDEKKEKEEVSASLIAMLDQETMIMQARNRIREMSGEETHRICK